MPTHRATTEDRPSTRGTSTSTGATRSSPLATVLRCGAAKPVLPRPPRSLPSDTPARPDPLLPGGTFRPVPPSGLHVFGPVRGMRGTPRLVAPRPVMPRP